MLLFFSNSYLLTKITFNAMSKFYKIFSLLLVACLATVGAWAQTPVKTVEDLENGAAYSITVPEQSIYD